MIRYNSIWSWHASFEYTDGGSLFQKMLNINRTNKSTLEAKQQPWSWIWERKQVRRSVELGGGGGRGWGGPEGRWIRLFVDTRQKVNRENDRSVPRSSPLLCSLLPHTVYRGLVPAQIRSVHTNPQHTCVHTPQLLTTCESGDFKTLKINNKHIPSRRFFTASLSFVFSHARSDPTQPSARQHARRKGGKKKSCGKRVVLLLWHSETESSVFCVRVTDVQSFPKRKKKPSARHTYNYKCLHFPLCSPLPFCSVAPNKSRFKPRQFILVSPWCFSLFASICLADVTLI